MHYCSLTNTFLHLITFLQVNEPYLTLRWHSLVIMPVLSTVAHPRIAVFTASKGRLLKQMLSSHFNRLRCLYVCFAPGGTDQFQTWHTVLLCSLNQQQKHCLQRQVMPSFRHCCDVMRRLISKHKEKPRAYRCTGLWSITFIYACTLKYYCNQAKDFGLLQATSSSWLTTNKTLAACLTHCSYASFKDAISC